MFREQIERAADVDFMMPKAPCAVHPFWSFSAIHFRWHSIVERRALSVWHASRPPTTESSFRNGALQLPNWRKRRSRQISDDWLSFSIFLATKRTAAFMESDNFLLRVKDDGFLSLILFHRKVFHLNIAIRETWASNTACGQVCLRSQFIWWIDNAPESSPSHSLDVISYIRSSTSAIKIDRIASNADDLYLRTQISFIRLRECLKATRASGFSASRRRKGRKTKKKKNKLMKAVKQRWLMNS